jgi:3-oxoacyl-[acyl-carrier protein] reductase
MLADKHVLVFAASGAIAGQGGPDLRRARRHGLGIRASTGRGREARRGHHRNRRPRARRKVDATDAGAVGRHDTEVAGRTGRIDAVFNRIDARPADLHHPARIADLDIEGLLAPLRLIVGSQYVTRPRRRPRDGRAGARLRRHAPGDPVRDGRRPHVQHHRRVRGDRGHDAVLAGELGPSGVRVNCVRGSAMPETRTIRETFAGQTAIAGRPPEIAVPPLRRPITVAETAATVAFLASDLSSGTTGQTLTVCAGALI